MNRADAIRAARHAGVLTRWAEAEKDPTPRMFAEVDTEGVPRRAMSRDEMAALVGEHRRALLGLAKRWGEEKLVETFEGELRTIGDRMALARDLRAAFLAAVESAGFGGRSR